MNKNRTTRQADQHAHKKRIRDALLATLLLGGTAVCAPSWAQPATSPGLRVITIEAGRLSDAIKALSTQTGVVVSVDERLVEGRRAPALSGSYTAQEALNTLLAGSGLTAVMAPDGTALLRAASMSAVELDKVVIIGTKQSQSRQQATQSVSVLTERDTIGQQSVFDLFSAIPNIAQSTKSFLPTVRGLDGNGVAAGGGGAVTGANPRMVNYIDGVARTYGATPDGQGSFWDLAQVEVYRGAQSTLLGQNALAGAIVQTTKDPRLQGRVCGPSGRAQRALDTQRRVHGQQGGQRQPRDPLHR